MVGSSDTGVDFKHEALVKQYRGNLGGKYVLRELCFTIRFDHNYNWFDGVRSDEFPECRIPAQCNSTFPLGMPLVYHVYHIRSLCSWHSYNSCYKFNYIYHY